MRVQWLSFKNTLLENFHLASAPWYWQWGRWCHLDAPPWAPTCLDGSSLFHTHRYTKIWASLSQHTAVTPSAFLVKTYVTGRWPHCGMQSFISCLSEPCLCISSSPPPPHPWLQGSIHPCHGALQPPESLAALLTQTATAHCQGSQQRDWPDARLELPTLLWF